MKRFGLFTFVLMSLSSLLGVMPSGSSAGLAASAAVFDTSAVAVGPGFTLPGSATSSALAGKYPSIVGSGTSVHMVSNTDQKVQYWSKQDTAASAAGPLRLGASPGDDTDYTEAAISAGPDGTLYAVYIIQNSSISLRRKLVNGSWEQPKSIYRTGGFMAYIDITVTADGQIFVVWNEAQSYRFVRSTNSGASWSSARGLSSRPPYKPIFITSGAGNQVMAAFGGGDGHAYVAIWNGSSFVTTDLTPFRRALAFYSFAQPVVAPNGKMYAAFSTPNPGGALYYAERQANGSWPISKLASGAVYGAIGFHADAQSNLHMTWSGNITGRWQLYYAFKPVSGDWQPIVRLTGVNNKVITDVDSSSTIGARVYNHNVFEVFDGESTSLRYQQFSADSSVLIAKPVLDSDAAATNSSRVSVSFVNVSGNPDSVRYHWDGLPSAADPWLPFANPLAIDGPPGVTPDVCGSHVLYTQVRRGATVQTTPQQDAEIFDTGVQAQAFALNPNLANLPSSDVGAVAGSPGASDGDPRYTREHRFFLSINGQADCAHLKEFTLTGSALTPLNGADAYHRPLDLPGDAAPGDKAFDLLVADQLNNQKTWSFTLTYDPVNTDTTGSVPNSAGLPVLGAGGSFGADDTSSIIRSLSFQGISVTDNLYGRRERFPAGKQFWGMLMANTISPTVTADDPSLHWYPVRAPAPSATFTVTWDLFTGLGYTTDLSNRPGDYYVYVRFLDGAGNPSKDALKAKVTLLPGYALASQRLAVIRR
jgi:hypothetical protein